MALNFANNNSLSAITSLPASISGGGMTLIQEQTASSSSTISFTSGIDSTYDVYVLKGLDIHGSVDGTGLQLNFSTDGGSNYNVTKTTTSFSASHNEADTSASLTYETSLDRAQSTSDVKIMNNQGADNDQSLCFDFILYNPSSTTFVKHFIIKTQSIQYTDGSKIVFSAGYCNTTNAINAIRLQMGSGNIDSGAIKLYGIS